MAQPGFGLMLQRLREGRKLSLRELAQLSEVDHAYIYRLESGEKLSPSEDVISKLIRALKAGKREADMLRYLAEHADTDSTLVDMTLKDPTISYEIFASAASAVFRGTGRPDYPKLIERVRKILKDESEGSMKRWSALSRLATIIGLTLVSWAVVFLALYGAVQFYHDYISGINILQRVAW